MIISVLVFYSLPLSSSESLLEWMCQDIMTKYQPQTEGGNCSIDQKKDEASSVQDDGNKIIELQFTK